MFLGCLLAHSLSVASCLTPAWHSVPGSAEQSLFQACCMSRGQPLKKLIITGGGTKGLAFTNACRRLCLTCRMSSGCVCCRAVFFWFHSTIPPPLAIVAVCYCSHTKGMHCTGSVSCQTLQCPDWAHAEYTRHFTRTTCTGSLQVTGQGRFWSTAITRTAGLALQL